MIRCRTLVAAPFSFHRFGKHKIMGIGTIYCRIWVAATICCKFLQEMQIPSTSMTMALKWNLPVGYSWSSAPRDFGVDSRRLATLFATALEVLGCQQTGDWNQWSVVLTLDWQQDSERKIIRSLILFLHNHNENNC